MMSQHANWRGTLGQMAARMIALATLALALALAAPLAVEAAPVASAAPATGAEPTSCGAAKSGCGPQVCTTITQADYTLPTTSPRGDARAELSRTGGVSGSTDTLTGSHWPAGATVQLLLGTANAAPNSTNIWVNPTPFAQGVADAHGNVIIAGFHTPQEGYCTPPDDKQYGNDQALFVAQTPDGKARVSLLFTFYPAPSLQSQTSWMVTGGEALLMTGSGWEPGQKITITPAFLLWPAKGYPVITPENFQLVPADATTATAQHDGTVTVSVMVPQEPPETQITFFASANGPHNGDVTVESNGINVIGPNGAASLTVNGSTAYAGDKVTVSGRNWPANQDIQIEYCRGQTQPLCVADLSETLADIMTDSSGGFTTTVQLPSDARPGHILIQASPLASPFNNTIYTQTQPFTVLYPFAQAHPRLEMALQVSPYVVAALLIGLLALGEWLRKRRAAAQALG